MRPAARPLPQAVPTKRTLPNGRVHPVARPLLQAVPTKRPLPNGRVSAGVVFPASR